MVHDVVAGVMMAFLAATAVAATTALRRRQSAPVVRRLRD
jgi:hypothetical protein